MSDSPDSPQNCAGNRERPLALLAFRGHLRPNVCQCLPMFANVCQCLSLFTMFVERSGSAENRENEEKARQPPGAMLAFCSQKNSEDCAEKRERPLAVLAFCRHKNSEDCAEKWKRPLVMLPFRGHFRPNVCQR